MEGIKDKVVIVTGGSRGIGRACVLAFSRAGAKVTFTYNRSREEAEKLQEEIEKNGGKCLSLQADIKDYDSCRKVVEATLDEFGEVDILVNNAGILKDRALVMMTPEDWKEVIDTNLVGTFNMTKSVITLFLKRKKGCIINISSISGIIGMPRQTNYSASKAGIIGFSKALAKEVASYGIRVNVVCPGFTNTDMVNSLREEIKEKIIESIPLKRLCEPYEVADLCVFLASDKAKYITGEVIKIDGGLAI